MSNISVWPLVVSGYLIIQHPCPRIQSQPSVLIHSNRWGGALVGGVWEGGCHCSPLQHSRWVCFSSGGRKWSKNDGVFVFWHFVSPRPHQGWALQTSSVNLGLLPSVSLSAPRLGGGRWALAENDPSGLIVFWPADWRWEEKQRHGEKERGGWVLMHLAAIREAYLTVWTQWANTHIHS